MELKIAKTWTIPLFICEAIEQLMRSRVLYTYLKNPLVLNYIMFVNFKGEKQVSVCPCKRLVWQSGRIRWEEVSWLASCCNKCIFNTFELRYKLKVHNYDISVDSTRRVIKLCGVCALKLFCSQMAGGRQVVLYLHCGVSLALCLSAHMSLHGEFASDICENIHSIWQNIFHHCSLTK